HEIREAMQLHQPEIVFNAAGINHAHLAEENIVHAARINILGAWIAAQEAVEANVERFVLVSSDNAAQRRSLFDLMKATAERVVRVSGPTLDESVANDYLSRLERSGDAEAKHVERLLRATESMCGRRREDGLLETRAD